MTFCVSIPKMIYHNAIVLWNLKPWYRIFIPMHGNNVVFGREMNANQRGTDANSFLRQGQALGMDWTLHWTTLGF